MDRFKETVLGSISVDGCYVILRNLDQNQIIFKQKLEFTPQTMIVDEFRHKILIKETYGLDKFAYLPRKTEIDNEQDIIIDDLNKKRLSKRKS